MLHLFRRSHQHHSRRLSTRLLRQHKAVLAGLRLNLKKVFKLYLGLLDNHALLLSFNADFFIFLAPQLLVDDLVRLNLLLVNHTLKISNFLEGLLSLFQNC